MLRKNDPVLHHVDRSFWEYAEKMDDGRMGCKFCGHVFAKCTSISRIKLHLAGVKHRGVRICGKVPQDVQEAALEAIDDGPPEKKLKTGAGSSNNEVTHPPKNLFCPGLGSYYDQLCSPSVKHDVIMDDVQSVVKEKTEYIQHVDRNDSLGKLSFFYFLSYHVVFHMELLFESLEWDH